MTDEAHDGATDGDSAFLDREYNPRLQIPDFSDYFSRWTAAAGAARDGLVCRLDLAYGPTPAEALDLFPGHGPGPQPLILFLHGGYWRALDKADFSWMARPYVARGISVAIVNYGLLPAVPLRRIIEQTRRACLWLYTHAESLGLDPRRIVGVGHSAGAHLLTMMLTTDWPLADERLPRQLFRACLAVSGLFDLEPLTRAPFLKSALSLTDQEAKDLSPLHHHPIDPAPLWVAVGADESGEFQRQARTFARAWGSPSVAGLLEVPAKHHFSICEGLGTVDDPLFALLLDSCGSAAS